MALFNIFDGKRFGQLTFTFQKIGNYLNRPEYNFQSKHTVSGVLYLVKCRLD